MSRAQQLVSTAARAAIAGAIKKGDTGLSKWWLERQDRTEFGAKSDVVTEEAAVVEQQQDELVESEEVIEDTRKMLDRLLILKWRMLKHDQITRSDLPQGDQQSKLTELYALPEAEKLKRALHDFATGNIYVPEPEQPPPPENAVFNPIQ